MWSSLNPLRSYHFPRFVHKGAAIFAGENVFEGELQMSSGADGASR
ncbi:hypothetical protein LINGRAHAP2_LOCUS24381 [Linum grandiflorum]